MTSGHFMCLFAIYMDYSLSGSSVMEFFRQESWSGLPFPFPGTLPDLGIEPRLPELQADSLPSEPLEKPPLRLHAY